jgi:hypothetical protein
VSVPGFETSRLDLIVTNALPVELSFRLRVLNTVEEVIVDAVRAPDSPATRASIAGTSLERIPIRSAAKGLQELVATLPGWATEDNGLLHARGTDDGFLYVVDGIPVYERLDQLSGVAPDPSSIESINVMTGFLPAEFGYKAGGVIDVRSKFAPAQWEGAVAINAGSERTASFSTTLGGAIADRLSVTIAGAIHRSDRFLDPVHPDNLHNRGNGGTGAATARWALPDRTLLTASAGTGRSRYQVPNTEDQQEAEQDQRQEIDQRFATANWQQVWNGSLYSQVSGYGRWSGAALVGSGNDTPLFANANRVLERVGGLGSLTWHRGPHVVKGGVDVQRLHLQESFDFAVTDRRAAAEAGFSRAARAFDQQRPFVFAGESTATLLSAYVQDDWPATDHMTIGAGLRLDRAELLLPRVQVSPRAGITYRMADRTVLRGSVSRFFQPPQPEYLLLSSSPEARVLSPFVDDESGGGADIEPERQWAVETGAAHDITQWARLDAAVWYRAIEHAADPNVFAGTTIIFPNAVASGRAYGLDLRLEIRRQRAWSGYASIATGRVRQRGPITGGLFLEDEVADLADGEEFIPDHDQAVSASGGVMWLHPSGRASLSAVIRYESGTPIGEADEADELAEQPGAEMVSFERGRVNPRTVVSLQGSLGLWKYQRVSANLQLAVHNLFDARYAYNFGNPFSGTHFGAPRTASAGLHVKF